jgi:hypothetical protein
MGDQNKDEMKFPSGKEPDKNDWKKFLPGGGKGKGPKFSLWFFLLALGVLALLNMFFTAGADNTIEYSKFKEFIESGVIKSVKMTPVEYTGYVFRNEDLQGQSFISLLTETQNTTG